MGGGAELPRVLIATPMKNTSAYLDYYLRLLGELDYPKELLSLGFLVSDSTDGTFERLEEKRRALEERYARVALHRHDFGFHLPEGVHRGEWVLQYPRRVVLAKSRNQLLFRSLGDEDWVLWIDADLRAYPPEVLRRLLDTGRDVVTPHCVNEWGGRSWDFNSWRDQGRVHLDGLRGGPDLVRLDAVGATMLLIRADLHRDGLIFPPFLYGRENPLARVHNPILGRSQTRGEVETEGLGLMAKDMGHECWGLLSTEIIH